MTKFENFDKMPQNVVKLKKICNMYLAYSKNSKILSKMSKFVRIWEIKKNLRYQKVSEISQIIQSLNFIRFDKICRHLTNSGTF